MKVLHVAPIVAGTATGPAASVPLQMLAEQQAGCEVGFLQSWPGAPLALPPGVLRVGMGAARIARWRDALVLPRLLARAGFMPDIVHFHSVYLPLHAAVAAVVRRLGLPTVNSPRGGLMPLALATRAAKKRAGDRLFFDRFCRRLALHRALNEAERDVCLQRYPGVPVAVAPNPVLLGDVAGPPAPRPGAGLVLGYLGRFDLYYKGLDLLLDGLRRAVAAGLAPGVRLRCCGPDHRGGAEALGRLVGRLGLASRVEVAGPVAGPTKRRFFEAIDVLVQPSRTEAMPMSVLEAMAAARPVLVTPATNLGAVVARHGAGWVVPGEPDALARAFLALPAMPEEVRARGAAARRAARLEFAVEAVGAALVAAYGEVLARPARRAA